MSNWKKITPLAVLAMLTISLGFVNRGESEIAYSWLQGTWTGNGFGGTSEEIWSAPDENGTVMGMYRNYKADGSLNFYEFLLLNEEGLHLKHFTSDLNGWEEKDDHYTFEKIKYSKNILEFKGLKFEYLPPDKLEIHLDMKTKEGQMKTEVFMMTRQ